MLPFQLHYSSSSPRGTADLLKTACISCSTVNHPCFILNYSYFLLSRMLFSVPWYYSHGTVIFHQISGIPWHYLCVAGCRHTHIVTIYCFSDCLHVLLSLTHDSEQIKEWNYRIHSDAVDGVAAFIPSEKQGRS